MLTENAASKGDVERAHATYTFTGKPPKANFIKDSFADLVPFWSLERNKKKPLMNPDLNAAHDGRRVWSDSKEGGFVRCVRKRSSTIITLLICRHGVAGKDIYGSKPYFEARAMEYMQAAASCEDNRRIFSPRGRVSNSSRDLFKKHHGSSGEHSARVHNAPGAPGGHHAPWDHPKEEEKDESEAHPVKEPH